MKPRSGRVFCARPRPARAVVESEATGVPETKLRNYENARHAYDTVVRLLRNLNPTPERREVLDERLSALKARLQAVGQQF